MCRCTFLFLRLLNMRIFWYFTLKRICVGFVTNYAVVEHKNATYLQIYGNTCWNIFQVMDSIIQFYENSSASFSNWDQCTNSCNLRWRIIMHVRKLNLKKIIDRISLPFLYFERIFYSSFSIKLQTEVERETWYFI